MAQSKSDTTDPPSAGRSPRGRSRSVGRAIATGIVVLGLVYIVGVGFISVIPQVFWPEAAPLEPGVSCTDGLRALKGELLDRAAARVGRTDTEEPSDLRPYLEAWDRRHAALEPRCGGEGERAWVQLAQMRGRLQATLERFDAEEGALARDVESTLARLER